MPVAWSPTQRYLDRSRLRRFANAQGVNSYDALLTWATEDLERFWRAVDRDLGLVWAAPYARAMDTSKGLPWTTWWTGGLRTPPSWRCYGWVPKAASDG